MVNSRLFASLCKSTPAADSTHIAIAADTVLTDDLHQQGAPAFALGSQVKKLQPIEFRELSMSRSADGSVLLVRG